MAAPLVLIAENEEGLLRLFTALIERLGYDVLPAEDGAAAIDLLDEYTPDLLILDMAMPHVSGTDVLAYIDEHPYLDSMRIMVLTALGSMPPMGGLEERIDVWAKKPILPNDLQNLVRTLVEDQ